MVNHGTSTHPSKVRSRSLVALGRASFTTRIYGMAARRTAPTSCVVRNMRSSRALIAHRRPMCPRSSTKSYTDASAEWSARFLILSSWQNGAGKWTRTTDQLLTKQLLCQLSYSGKLETNYKRSCRADHPVRDKFFPPEHHPVGECL